MTVQQVPNLVVSSVSNPPSTASIGGKFNFTNSVRNTGSVVAAATGTKYYLVSIVDGTKQDLKGNQAVPALNAGQTFSLQVSLEVRDRDPARPVQGPGLRRRRQGRGRVQ